MKNRNNILSILLVATAVLSCNNNKKDNGEKELEKLKKEQQAINDKVKTLENKVGAKDSVKKIAVRVMSMTPTIFTNYINVEGKVDANNSTVASPEAPGVIQNILVHIGQYVHKGQTVATLKTTNIQGISDGISELDLQLSFAKTLYEKQQRLWAQEIGTQIQLLSAKNNYEALLKKRQTLNNQIGTSKKMLSILAPTDGVIDAIDIREGSAVSPGMPLGIRIVNTNNLKVKANIAENYGSKVNTGDEVLLIFPDIQESLVTKIGYVTKVIDPVSRTFIAEIPLRANGKYRPNMIVKAKIVGYQNQHAFALPASLIQTTAEGKFVYIANNKGTAELRQVTTGENYEGKIEIKSGLVLGDNIIIAGYEDLNNGEPIQIIQ